MRIFLPNTTSQRIFAVISILVISLVSVRSWGQISYTTAGASYTQSFDNLFTTVPANNTTVAASTLPTGWQFVEAQANANTTLRVDNGSSGTGDTYLYGASSSNERAFGAYASGSLTSQFGASFINNTGATLTQFTLSYTGEQWKDGGSSAAVFNTDSFYYSVGATALNTGTYTAVTQLNFTALVNNTNSDVTLDGNLAANQRAITYTVTGISWAPGATMFIKWSDPNDAGNDDGLAIDNVTFSASGASATLTPLPTALTGFTYVVGSGPSASQSFALSGSNLTAGATITINGSTDYEVSKDNSTFGASTSLTYTGTILSSTNIYVRLKAGLAIASYNSETIGISGGGATSSVTVSGSVTSASCTNPTITAQPSTTAQTPCQNTTATALSVTATGSTLAYQWYSNAANANTGGTAVSGATSSSYTPSTTATGILYYYVIVSSGTCTTTSSVSGSVTVTASSIIALSSAAGTDAQTVPLNNPITNITYNIGGGGTGASVSGLPGGVTGSYASGVFTISGSPSATGTFNYTVTATGGCNNNPTANGTITVASGSTNLTQSGFTSVLTPQYMSSGTSTRLPVMYRATVTGLTASTTYRYYTQGSLSSNFGLGQSGAGNPLLINSTGTTYTYTTGVSLTTAGNYESFTTDGSGNYTGWFGFVNTGSATFTAGNLVYPTITIGDNSGTLLYRRALDVGVTALAPATAVAAANGSFFQSKTSATPKNLVALFDNIPGTGRPLSITPVEYIANAGAGLTSRPLGYDSSNGAWNAIIPNTNANGVRLIEQLSVTTGNLVGCAATSATGIWPTGSITTVNPTNGTTFKVISGNDDPLIAPTITTQPSTTAQSTCQNGTAFTALSIAATGGTITYQWYSSATSSNTGGTLIGGATSASYTPANTIAGTSYYYAVATNNSCSTASNVSGVFTVNPSTTITANPGGATYCQNAIAAALSVTATGTGALTYQWYSNATNSNSGGTSLGISNGAQTSAYTPVTTTAGTTYYYVLVTGSCGTATSNTAAVTVTASTVITANPAGATYCQNATATALSVTASGTGTLTYQWYSNTANSNTGGTPVSTSVTYTPSTASAGTLYYYVTVTGTCGSATSSVATITINPSPAATVAANSPYACSGTGGSFTITGTPNSTVFYNIDGGSTASKTLDASGSATVPVGFITGSTTLTLTSVSASGTGCASTPTGAGSFATITSASLPVAEDVTGGGNYCSGDAGVPVGLSGSEAGVNYQLLVNDGTTTSPVGSPVAGTGGAVSFGNQTIVGTYSVQATNTTTGCVKTGGGATVMVGQYTPATITTDAAPTSQTVCQNGTPTDLTVTAVGNNLMYQWYSNTTNTTTGGMPVGGNSSSYTPVTTTAGTLYYYVTVSGPCRTVTSSVVSVTVNAQITPSVTIAASANPICAGGSVTFTSTISGGGSSPTYQWQVNGMNATGASTGSAYTSATLNNGDVVTVLLTSNSACAVPATVTSNSITETVNPNVTPSVSIVSSAAGTVCSGTNITFTATPVNGGTMPLYQWQVNGANAPGASTGSTYTTSTLNNGDAVTVILTSNATCVTTATATSNAITASVSAPSTVTLTSAAGTDNQAAIQGTAITNITYAIGGGATNATVTGLPTGVTGTYSSGVETISGTPAVTGTFNYTVTATGGCNNNPAANGTIAVCVIPTQQDTGIVFTSILPNSLTANWTNGNGTGRVVYINTANSFTNPANSATALTANPVYSGSGQQVVYNGTNDSVAVSGLLPASTYWFRVYEYNNCSGTYVYDTTGALANHNPNSTKTLGAPLVQSNFISVLTPKYVVASSSTARLPLMFRATVTGLSPNTNYRYYTNAATNSTTGGGTVDFGNTNSGAGNPLYVNSAGTVYKYTTSASVSTVGGYDSLTTDASGNYTGWFGLVNTNNARFTAGNILYPTITLGNSAGVVIYRYALNDSMTALAYGTTATATSGSFFQSKTNGTPKNIAAIFDNTSASGKPLYIAPIEYIASTGAGLVSRAGGYDSSNGAWNAIIPNVNANGVRAIEQLSITTGNLVGCVATDADGIWTTGNISTVNPTNGATVKIIAGKDDPLATCPVYPEINVQQNSTDYLTGSTFAFGNVNNNTSKDTIFTIQNTGTDTLKISSVAVAGTGFSLVSTAPTIILAGSSAAVTVRFSPTAATNYTGTLTITNNDNDEGSYVINLAGAGVVPLVPVVAVQQGATGYANGSTYTYSNTIVNTNNDVTFTIQNTGNTPLTISSIVVSGTAYSLQGTAPTSVAAGSTATFVVRFTPTAITTYTGSVTINSNDPNQGTYVINLSGAGVTASVTTNTISGSPFCISGTSSANVSVPFSYTPTSSYTGTFTAQLSDASGSFASPVIIGTIASDGSGSQTIAATIPAGTAAGSGYRIRVVSNTPAVTGSDNGTNLTITNPVAPSVSIVANPAGTICTGSSVTFTATPTNGGAAPSYQWQVNGSNVTGATGSTFTTSTLANGNTVDVVLTSNATCITTTTATSNVITETVTAPSTITLTSAAGTNNQTINQGSAITNITYTIGGGGTSATVTGLPTGITGTYNAGTFTISGTPTVTGTFTYTVTATGGCNNNPVATGTLFICAAPTTQATSLTFTNVLANSMTVSWTNGNGSGRVVFINTANSFTNPTSSTTALPANPVYGGSGQQVVYNGTGSSVGVSGLNASTTYWYRVYEYNNCAGTYVYDTASVAGSNPLSKATTGALLTQSNFISVLTPKYMADSSGTNVNERLPVAFRATVTGLLPNTQYRYYTQGATNSTANGGSIDFGTTNTGAGNPLLINNSGASYVYTSSPSVSTAGGYDSLTTDASGNYTGWFAFVNTGNTRFKAGNAVYPSITIGSTSGSILYRRVLDSSITPLSFKATSTDTSGSFFQSKTLATARNLAALFDNTSATGRPLFIAPIEYIANTGVALANRISGYDSSNGAWNAIIPNNNANGVQLIEQLSVSTGSVTGCVATDADGIWPTGNISTVNPANGKTVKIISGNDDPLAPPTITTQPSATAQGVCQNSAATPLTVTATGGTLTYQWYSNTTASNTGGTLISGATTASYTPQTATAGITYYYVVVSNTLTCSVTSNVSGAVTVTSTAAPSVSITANPGGAICAGTSVTFTATPTNGGTSPAYQWQLNGMNINGATGATYTTTTLFDNDQVDVVLTSSLACVTSAMATSNIITETITPASTITLTSAAGTDTQNAIQNTAITPITYAIGGSATGATVTGLPTGVTGTYSGGTETISGTPTVSGTFTYTITATGGCVSTANGTITICAVPSIQDTGIVFTNVLANSMTVKWTTGNGIGRVVIINTANVFTTPTNSTTLPAANAVYNGSGQQVVFNGTIDSVNVSGLDASTTYWYRVYEYNNCSGTYVYDTAAATANHNPNSQKTTGFPLTQSNFISIVTPQYMASSSGGRLPVMFRAAVTGLKPNTNYRYYIQGATNSTTGGGTVDFGTTNSGAGNPLLINSNGTVYKYVTSTSVTAVTGYDSLTTDASGNYTGWFGFVNTTNPRFTAGNIIYPTITLGNSSGITLYRRALDVSITPLTFSTTSAATSGSFFQSKTNGTPKNLAALFDNTSASGRPLSVTPIEYIANTGAGLVSRVSGYDSSNGAWNAIIPNVNANGVRTIEQLSVTTGNLVGCAATDADGIWPTGNISTVNPGNGATAKMIATKDDPLATCPIYPQLNVQQGGTSYTAGSIYTFSNTPINTTNDVIFTIQNTGADTLKISSLIVSGTAFTLQGTVPATILAGNSATITVRFAPTAATTYTGAITINSNDPNQATYVVNLNGTGYVPLIPVIAVQQNGTGYANGSTYTYSNTLVNTNNDVTFTIQNTGNTTLTVSGTVVSGTAYSLQGTTPTSVAAGSTATFVVRFTPTSNITYTGSITINSDDPNQGTYVVNLSGRGVVTTITTGTISGSPFCVSASSGAAVSVPFTYTSPTFYMGNFRAELSDASGSFASPVVIGTIASDQSGSQTIAATIPAGTVAGIGYRIRVVSNAPAITGSDNGTNLVITNPVAPSVSIAANPTGTICTGSSVTFTATPTNGGATPSYQWQVNGADVNGATGNTFTTSTLSNGNTVDVVLTTSAACITTTKATLNVITETVTAPSTITLTSASGTDNQNVNQGAAITNITYSIGGGGTGATVAGLPTGVTGTYSSGVETISGTPTAGGTFTYIVTATGGCNNNPTVTGTITVCGAPTAQDSSIVFSNVAANSLTIGWTAGNGSGRVVIMNTANTFTNPTNSTTALTANTAYGGSGQQVVYNGTGNSVSVTSLIPSTTYYFRVYEYNICTGTYNYDTASATGNPASKATISALVTQAGFTSVLTPQYMVSSSSSRLPVMFRATVTGLSAGTTYRYFVQGAIATDFGTTNPGAGNPLLINSTGTTYTYSSGASISTAGNYETFTTDASGNYTGWFGFVNTTNARFAAGNSIYPCIVIGNTSGNTLSRRALDVAITPLTLSTTSAATNGSFFQSKTSATPKNLAALFDNTAGTGRPLSITPVEYIANAGTGFGTTRPANYDSSNGAWNAIIPNVNASGVELIEQLSVTTGNLVGCAATDADGVWPTGNVSTVNPTNGATVKVISGTDDPLASPTFTTQPSTTAQSYCQNSTATALSVTATGGTLTYQWYSNTTASNTSGTLINGATSASYTPPTATIGTTYYYVVISNGSCSATSNLSGAITVNTVVTPTVSISQLPASPVCTGSSVTFTATPSNGGAMPMYQWQVNSMNVSGATGSTFTISTLNNGDKVDVVLTSSSSCVTTTTVTSNIDTVTVTAPSTITLTSAAGTNNQAAIQNVAITPIAYAIGGGATGATVTGLPTGITGTYSSGTFTISGTPTVTGTFSYTVTATGGCSNNPTATGTITVCGAPTTQASSLTFTNILANSMTVGWTNGNGAGRVVYINTSNSFTNPVNSTTALAANSVYSGSGQQVVYNGTGNSVSVSGLLPSTTYYFRVYEYNNCTGTYVYNTATATSNPLGKSTTGALLTQTNFKSVLTPKYMADSAGNVAGANVPERLAVMYRATVTGLSPNTQYRYYTQAATNSLANGATVDFSAAQSGAGNPLLVNSSGTSYVYSTSPDLKTSQQYDSLTTDAVGNYTGWFGFVNTANTRFRAGNAVYPTITVGNTAGVILYRFALDSAITPLSFKTTLADTSGSFFQSKTLATPKNLVALFDNTAGTGRPLYIAPVEYIASTGAALQYRATGYDSSNGAWNAIIPNVNTNGVRLIEQLSVTTGNLVGCSATDADGIWPTGNVSTANPTNGKTVKVISGSDDPLAPPTITSQPSTISQTVCQGGTTALLSVMATGGALTYQWYSNTTASNTGGTVITGATSATYTPPATTAGTAYYYVIVSNTATCSTVSTVSGSVTVNALPDATISASHHICSGSGSGVVISSITGGTVYYHTTVGTTNSAEQSVVVPANGGVTLSDMLVANTTYTLDSVKSGVGCITFLSAASTVTVDAAPTIAVTGDSSQTVCKNSDIVSVTYTASGSATSVTVSNYGGLTVSNNSTASVTVSGKTLATVTYLVITSGSSVCPPDTITGTITVYPYITWTGATSTDWSTASNWCSGIVPTAADSVIIPALPVVPREPVLTANTTVGGLHIDSLATVDLNSQNFTTGAVTGAGMIIGSLPSTMTTTATGTVKFAGTNNTIKNLVISAGTLTLGNALNIKDSGIVTVASGAHLNTGDSLTLRSDSLSTGSIAQNLSGAAYITGKVTVERYTTAAQAATPGTPRRAWRLITAPVLGQTINDGWQEGGLTTTGFGTKITGEGLMPAQASAEGFDYIGGGNHTSIKQYDSAGVGAWVPLSTNGTALGTFIPLRSHQAYMLFVRGNRTIGATGASSANVRAKGTLLQGDQQVTIGTGTYTVVGNPYAATLDFSTLASHNAVIQDKFYLWNSKLSTYGAYVLVDHNGAGGAYQATPYPMDSTTVVPNSDSYKYISSGSGFLVSPANTGGTLTISETDKSDGTKPGVNPFRVVTATNIRQLVVNLNQKNSDNSTALADGFRAKFSDDYLGNETDNSSTKLANFNENLGLVRGGKDLIIESRGDVQKTDTLFMKMWYVTARSYQLQMKADNFTSAPGVQAWLVDSYLSTRTPVSLRGDIASFDFTVTADSGSWKQDRFMIVFTNSSTVLAVTLTGVKAAPQNGGVSVSWTVSHETNIRQYTVEKSTDGGRTFATSGAPQEAKNNPGAALTSYSGFDALPKTGDNYYRIRIEGQDGTVSYSQTVKVTIGGSGTQIEIVVYPNPVREGKVNLQMTNLAVGTYLVSVYMSGSGQTVYQKKVTITQANTTQSEELIMGAGIAQGSYQLRVADHNGAIIKEAQLVVGR